MCVLDAINTRMGWTLQSPAILRVLSERPPPSIFFHTKGIVLVRQVKTSAFSWMPIVDTPDFHFAFDLLCATGAYHSCCLSHTCFHSPAIERFVREGSTFSMVPLFLNVSDPHCYLQRQVTVLTSWRGFLFWRGKKKGEKEGY